MFGFPDPLYLSLLAVMMEILKFIESFFHISFCNISYEVSPFHEIFHVSQPVFFSINTAISNALELFRKEFIIVSKDIP